MHGKAPFYLVDSDKNHALNKKGMQLSTAFKVWAHCPSYLNIHLRMKKINIG